LSKAKIHIVSFDIPYPANAGGAIDVYYKDKNLSEAGCEVYLHCYEYGSRTPQPILEQYCNKVWYYKRHTGLSGLSATMPYIVSSRKGDELLANLLLIDAPILFEGVHTTFYLSHPSLKDRLKLVRTQNVEQEYYKGLKGKATSLLSKVYFAYEAMMLSVYENKMSEADAFLTVSLYDQRFFAHKYPHKPVYFVPSFHSYSNVAIVVGRGDFCLYHANLGHPENQEVLQFLLQEVVPHSAIRFVIAGRNPSEQVINRCKELSNCALINNPDDEVMHQLIQDAHIHVLPTFQESGIKLKLLSSLFGGRYILVNKSMLFGTDFSNVCHIAETGKEFVSIINKLATVPFAQEDIEKRKIAMVRYTNSVNAQNIINILNANTQ
jgi:glycosyltransferase involved in cell wall biosynthesis